MSKIYSTYEAKARFSEVLRQVREGRTVTISYRGEPVAELRPIERAEGDVAGRLSQLEDRGVLVRGESEGRLGTVKRRAGALRRFLKDRDD